MKDNVGTATGGPTDGVGVTPALITDGDAEGERAGLEDTTFRAEGVDRILGGVKLNRILELGYGNIRVFYESGCAGGCGVDVFDEGLCGGIKRRCRGRGSRAAPAMASRRGHGLGEWKVGESRAKRRHRGVERTPNPRTAFARQGAIP